MAKPRTAVESCWLRLLAPFEKNTLFLPSGRNTGCPSHATLSAYAAGESTHDPVLEKHLRRCPDCIGILQLLTECETVLDDPKSLRDIPRGLLTAVRRFTRVTPPSLAVLVLRIDHGLTVIRNTLCPATKPEQEAPRLPGDGLHLQHATPAVSLALALRETPTGWSLSLSGRMPDGGAFPGEPVLVDRYGRLISHPTVDASGFHFLTLPPGEFTLSILLPSKKGVAEVEKLLFFVRHVKGC